MTKFVKNFKIVKSLLKTKVFFQRFKSLMGEKRKNLVLEKGFLMLKFFYSFHWNDISFSVKYHNVKTRIIHIAGIGLYCFKHFLDYWLKHLYDFIIKIVDSCSILLPIIINFIINYINASINNIKKCFIMVKSWYEHCLS